MKYLSSTMTQAEAKAAYRKLSKTLHPDMGGDEEEFKILADEYATIVKSGLEHTETSYEDLMAAVDRRVAVIVDTLNELYPRTPTCLRYTHNTVEVEISGNTPLRKMLHIEEVIQSLGGFQVTLYFKRGGARRWYTMYTQGTYTCINVDRGETVSLINMQEIYAGKRYTISRNKRYEMCHDKKLDRYYILRRTPKFSLKELLDL